MNINEKLIIECLNELNKNALAKQKYKDYYEGNHSILKSYQMQDSRSNRKLIFNFPRKFVDNETGYILGKPVNYISKSDDPEIITASNKNTSHWDKEHNINLRKQSEIYGEAYELNYVNTDGEFSATILTPLNSYVLEDGTAERNVVLGLHTFTKKFDDQKYLDVYTANEILHEESTVSNINRFEEILSSSVQTAVEERLKSTGYTPPNSSGNEAKPKNLNDALKNYYADKNNA